MLLPKRSWKAGVLGLGAALGLGVQLTRVCVQHPKLAQYNPAGSSYDGPLLALPVLKLALCFSQPQLGFLKPTQVGRPRGTQAGQRGCAMGRGLRFPAVGAVGSATHGLPCHSASCIPEGRINSIRRRNLIKYIKWLLSRQSAGGATQPLTYNP